MRVAHIVQEFTEVASDLPVYLDDLAYMIMIILVIWINVRDTK